MEERDGPVRNINIVIPFLMNNATNATDDANANNANNTTAVSVRDILFGAKDEGTLGNGQIKNSFQMIKLFVYQKALIRTFHTRFLTSQ